MFDTKIELDELVKDKREEIKKIIGKKKVWLKLSIQEIDKCDECGMEWIKGTLNECPRCH